MHSNKHSGPLFETQNTQGGFAVRIRLHARMSSLQLFKDRKSIVTVSLLKSYLKHFLISSSDVKFWCFSFGLLVNKTNSLRLLTCRLGNYDEHLNFFHLGLGNILISYQYSCCLFLVLKAELQWCHFQNLPDCFTGSNTCLYPFSNFIYITDDY